MRLIDEDTNKGDMKDPLSLNLYDYCIDNPIVFVDINGHDRASLAALIRYGGFLGTGEGGGVLLYTLYS